MKLTLYRHENSGHAGQGDDQREDQQENPRDQSDEEEQEDPSYPRIPRSVAFFWLNGTYPPLVSVSLCIQTLLRIAYSKCSKEGITEGTRRVYKLVSGTGSNRIG